jgi:hypothetical protein
MMCLIFNWYFSIYIYFYRILLFLFIHHCDCNRYNLLTYIIFPVLFDNIFIFSLVFLFKSLVHLLIYFLRSNEIFTFFFINTIVWLIWLYFILQKITKTNILNFCIYIEQIFILIFNIRLYLIFMRSKFLYFYKICFQNLIFIRRRINIFLSNSLYFLFPIYNFTIT